MRITFLTVAMCAVFCFGAQASENQLEQIRPDKAQLTTGIRYISAAARGYISGYKKGLYKMNRYLVDTNCFNQKTQSLIVESLDSWGSPGFNWNDEILGIGTALNMITDFCEYDETLYDILTYCYDIELACDPFNVLQTLLKKVFQVTTIANDFAALMQEGLPKENDKVDRI